MIRVAGLAAALALLIPGSPAHGEVTQEAGIRLFTSAELLPRALPRYGTAPVTASIAAHIVPTAAGALPQLRYVAIALNGHGRLDYGGLPICGRKKIEPASSAEALAACHDSLVGTGHFSSDVRLPEESPFPSEGRILAFNGRYQGRPALLAQIFGTEPVPTSYVLPFRVRRTTGTFGTLLKASLPALTGSWGYVTGIELTLGREYRSRGHIRGYLSAGCPAPSGFDLASYPLARTSFSFEGGETLRSTLGGLCRAKG